MSARRTAGGHVVALRPEAVLDTPTAGGSISAALDELEQAAADAVVLYVDVVMRRACGIQLRQVRVVCYVRGHRANSPPSQFRAMLAGAERKVAVTGHGQ